ncbi:MAG: 3-oxoadipate enol-lactonase [Rhodobacteraceae bacterium]|nr:3-oxoadipate enol-lactonase [Paracoccaceae bacterium]
MTLVNAGDVTLNTRVDGPDGAPWIVLSNSLGASLEMWDPQIAALTQRYRVLRYDTRGHGNSAVPPGPYSFDQLTGDVTLLMDAMGIATASFMGLSLGGMTGLGLALAHPDRFERIICADARADAPEGFRAMWDDRIAKVKAGGPEAIADMTLATWFTDDWRAENPDYAGTIRTMVVATPQDGYIACCEALKTLDFLRHLDRITIPTLFVGGSDDKGAAPDVMQAMADATPGARYIEVPSAAHVANINAPDAFNAAIRPFLGIGSE